MNQDPVAIDEQHPGCDASATVPLPHPNGPEGRTMRNKTLDRAAICVKSPARLSQDDADRQTQMRATVDFREGEGEGEGLGIGVLFGDPKNSREGDSSR